MSEQPKYPTSRSVSYDDAAMMTDAELVAMALDANPGLKYARVNNGLTIFLEPTRCITLWRNEECYLAGDPPRGQLESFPPYRYSSKAGGPHAAAGKKEEV